jgi:hypothetical protein
MQWDCMGTSLPIQPTNWWIHQIPITLPAELGQNLCHGMHHHW